MNIFCTFFKIKRLQNLKHKFKTSHRCLLSKNPSLFDYFVVKWRHSSYAFIAFPLFHRVRLFYSRIKIVGMRFLNSGHITWLRFFNSSFPLGRLLFPSWKHALCLTILLTSFFKASTMACRVSLTSADIILIKASRKWGSEKSRIVHWTRGEFMLWYLLRTEVKYPPISLKPKRIDIVTVFFYKVWTNSGPKSSLSKLLRLGKPFCFALFLCSERNGAWHHLNCELVSQRAKNTNEGTIPHISAVCGCMWFTRRRHFKTHLNAFSFPWSLIVFN